MIPPKQAYRQTQVPKRTLEVAFLADSFKPLLKVMKQVKAIKKFRYRENYSIEFFECLGLSIAMVLYSDNPVTLPGVGTFFVEGAVGEGFSMYFVPDRKLDAILKQNQQTRIDRRNAGKPPREAKAYDPVLVLHQRIRDILSRCRDKEDPPSLDNTAPHT